MGGREQVIILYLNKRLKAPDSVERETALVNGYFPMSLSILDVKRIAQLARLELTESQAQDTLTQLESVFKLIEELQSIDTSAVEPMAHAQDVMLRLREDTVSESDARERFQTVAPSVEAGLYLVPKVIE